jgi:hypothetical protein
MGTPAKIYAGKYGTTVLDGIVQSSFSKGLQQSLIGGGGGVYATFGWRPGAMPRASFESVKVGAMLTAFGIEAKEIDSAASPTALGLDLYTVDAASGAMNDTTGSKLAVASGAVIPRSLSIPLGQAARYSADILMAKADGSCPYTIQKGQTLADASITIDVDEAWTLGTVSIGGTEVDYCQGVEIDFGNDQEQMGSDGQSYPTLLKIGNPRPTLSITTQDTDQIADLTAAGGSGVVVAQLLKYDPQTGIVADSGHKTLTTSLALTADDGWSQGHGEDIGVTISHAILHDGVNDSIIIA